MVQSVSEPQEPLGATMYDVIRRLREGFLACGLEPPEYIILNASEGMKFMGTLGVDRMTLTVATGNTATIVTGPNGEMFTRVVLFGMGILWPVQSISRRG